MKLLATYRHFPCTIARYLVEALRDLGHTVETLGAPYGTYIPWTSAETGIEGMHLPDKYIDTPTYPIDHGVDLDWGAVEGLMGVNLRQYDAVFQMNPGWRVTEKYPYNDIPHVLVMTDPHVLRWWYDQAKEDFTHVVSMQMHYALTGEYVMPYGYSPHWHYLELSPPPAGSNVDWWYLTRERDIDVAMIGLQYPNRLLVTDEMEADGYSVLAKVGLFGDEYRAVYNRAKVGFTWSSRKDTIARVFEIPRMGAAMATNRTPDLPLFFREGIDYAAFGEAREAIDVCESLVQDQSRRIMLSNNAYVRGAPHTYNQRMAFLLGSLQAGASAQAHNQKFMDWLMSL